MPSWDPAAYDRFKADRDRPALDLLSRIPDDLDPAEIWDLGCGAGEHAALLASRHPGARVHGLDSSPEMLARARSRTARVDWVEGDLYDFAPATAPDLIFSNAAMQWAPDHAALAPRLAGSLAPSGVLACQMPAAHDAPWFRALEEIVADRSWADLLGAVVGVHPVATAERYHDWLSPICGWIDIWTTEYLMELAGDDPVIDWTRGTVLRPYLDALPDAAARDALIEAYRDRLRSVLPVRAGGVTLLPFARRFIIARR